jgi:predicted secreted protein
MVINGNDLLVYVHSGSTDVPIACSTSCSLTINQDTIDASCKNSGSWNNFVPGTKSWEVSVDALYTLPLDGNKAQFVDLMAYFLTEENELTIQFGEPGTTGHYYWSGSCMISSLNLNGDKDSSASWTASFKGKGALTQHTS